MVDDRNILIEGRSANKHRLIALMRGWVTPETTSRLTRREFIDVFCSIFSVNLFLLLNRLPVQEPDAFSTYMLNFIFKKSY